MQKGKRRATNSLVNARVHNCDESSCSAFPLKHWAAKFTCRGKVTTALDQNCQANLGVDRGELFGKSEATYHWRLTVRSRAAQVFLRNTPTDRQGHKVKFSPILPRTFYWIQVRYTNRCTASTGKQFAFPPGAVRWQTVPNQIYSSKKIPVCPYYIIVQRFWTMRHVE